MDFIILAGFATLYSIVKGIVKWCRNLLEANTYETEVY
ncbi:hypothetical protein M2349_000353 [Caldanaerobacter subterraneus subsp. tengcongensis MB4]|nr:hypothetical protein O163_07275 [Caldanaerobacter subterraneus subsp. yonseiensis KB-1]MCS3915212.1 hypothetical protein [Caldanaerobacter subterraneus subsp. tengcongensis MB4]